MSIKELTMGHHKAAEEQPFVGVMFSGKLDARTYAIFAYNQYLMYEALENAFQIGNWESDKVSFYLPYLDGDKETILRDSENSLAKLDLDFDTVFSNTNTSYNPDEKGRSSGKSGADVERILAFNAIGRPDPVTYIKPWDEVLEDAIKTEIKHKEKNK